VSSPVLRGARHTHVSSPFQESLEEFLLLGKKIGSAEFSLLSLSAVGNDLNQAD